MNYPTWSDLNNESIVPPLGARQARDIGPCAVLVSTEPDIRYLRTLPGKSETRSFFMGSLMTRQADGISIAGPYIGAPYGVMLLESLIAKGAQDILVLGWCGAISPDLNCGDLVIPAHAIVDEGTSCNYQKLDPELPCTTPDQNLSDQLYDHVKASGLGVSRLPIWTTDAIYRETPQKVAWFREKGACAVEMECSALFAVAQFRRVNLTALLVVSDSLASGDWEPGFRKKTFKAARKSACDAVINFAGKMITDET
ncbi:MAG: nucleoside phosphorylase [Proteobacteria bacterium]|nr:nucleoside phosphorylase [Desulfobacula sp.]MBU3954142.1 nucleoside phosphorylase [Pseudomonadota bacterium]MBU4129369.1 nucleoside phosphorylase [Pseudomonadota bacterium]